MVISGVDNRLVNDDVRAIIDQLLRVSVLTVSERVQDWRVLIVSSLTSTGQSQWAWSSSGSSICNESHIWSSWVVGGGSVQKKNVERFFRPVVGELNQEIITFYFVLFLLTKERWRSLWVFGSPDRVLFIPRKKERMNERGAKQWVCLGNRHQRTLKHVWISSLPWVASKNSRNFSS